MSSESPPTLETAECEKLLEALLSNAGTAKKQRKAVRNHCMALLMLEAGLRVGELVSLRMSNLYVYRQPVTTILLNSNVTKNKVEHSIPVSLRLCQALISYLNAWPCLDPDRGKDFAFANSTSKRPLTTKQVERIICAAAWKSLGRPVNPHMLRHTFGTRLMRVTNEAVVQQLLGHKFMSSTQVYLHPNEQDKRQAIDRAMVQPGQEPSAEQPQQDHPPPAEPKRPGPPPASLPGAPRPGYWR